MGQKTDKPLVDKPMIIDKLTGFNCVKISVGGNHSIMYTNVGMKKVFLGWGMNKHHQLGPEDDKCKEV